MALKSQLFAGDPKLEAAARSNPAHILRGAIGEHVSKIQKALIQLDEAPISKAELSAKLFGETTENSVLAYKRKRKIINFSYQKQADPIVGIMTMAALDKELVEFERTLDEITVLSSIASVLGYTPIEPHFIIDDRPLRQTVKVMQSNIKKR